MSRRFALAAPVPGPLARGSRPARAGWLPRADDLYHALLASLAGLVFAVVALILFETARGAAPSISAFGWKFLTSTAWDPVAERFGALPYLYGTVVSSALALALALPLGLGTAIFLAELAPPRLGNAVAFLVELLASIPSIVYGIWGVFVLAPWLRTALEPWLIAHLGFLPLFQGFPFGIGMINAGIVLAVMVSPTLISLSREILLSLPRSLRESALALGATRAESIGVMIDAARPGLLGAAILGLGRALGETMAVTMVIGNTNRISASLLAPGATMASVIANEFTEATGTLYLSALIEIALVLFALTVVVNALARLLVYAATGSRRDIAGAA
ncbi:MAG TPA: phosphate ABC transporter permease subunit PstC [Candidatus Eisenbacteria bacterium]|jgi:phosphate transport system permease protein